MKLPSLNITDWLSRQNPKVQAQFEILFFLTPFFLGWFVFLYYWVFLLWDAWSSLPAPSVIMSLGYMFYFRWVNVVRNEATSLDGINMTLEWNEAIVMGYQNVVEGWMSLKESELWDVGYPVPQFCLNCGVEVPDLTPDTGYTVSSVHYCPTCGADLRTPGAIELDDDIDFNRFWFKSPMWTPEGEEFKQIVFIHHGPKDKVFRKLPHQWFSHGGQVFTTSTSNVRATYVGFVDEVEKVMFFYVGASPEITRRRQMELGFIPEDVGPDSVDKAMKMSSNREAIHWRLKHREATDYIDVLNESLDNVKDKAFRGSYRLTDDLDKVRESKAKPFWKERENVTKIVIALIILVVGYVLLNNYILPYFMQGETPPPEPLENATLIVRDLRRRLTNV